MRRGTIVFVALAAGCGPSLSESEERGTEQRLMEERVQRAEAAQRKAELAAAEMVKGGHVLEKRVADAEKLLGELGATDGATLARMKDDEARRRTLEARAKVEREQLEAGLRDALHAGVVRLEGRGGSLRLVLPEEALFAGAGWKVNPAGKSVIAGVARELAKLPTRRLLVAAHRDAPKGAVALTAGRAVEVAAALVAGGVEEGRVTVAALGASDPLPGTTGSADTDGARNRRVEIVLVPWPDYVPPPAPPPPAAKAARPAVKPAASTVDDPGLLP